MEASVENFLGFYLFSSSAYICEYFAEVLSDSSEIKDLQTLFVSRPLKNCPSSVWVAHFQPQMASGTGAAKFRQIVHS